MKILLSGGGTAGHINPAVAIAKYALEKNKDTQVLFVGTKKGLESTLVPKENFDIKFVDVEGLSGGISLKSVLSGAKMAIATLKSISIIKKFKPDIVIGTGGYVCVSSAFAAHLLGIPSIIHEQNVFLGSAVKFLSDKCSLVAISFEESKKYLNTAKKICLTGNPVRPAIISQNRADARQKLNIGNKKFILSFGGSLGANKINDVMTDFIERNHHNKDIVIYFGTGARDFERVSANIKKRGITLGDNIKVLPYIDNMDILMNAADLAICRSGAITIAEICALGIPSVLVPSPNVTNNHQEYNARALSDNGAAITILEKDFDIVALEKAVWSVVYDEEKSNEMKQKAKKKGIVNATEKIYNEMCTLTGKK